MKKQIEKPHYSKASRFVFKFEKYKNPRIAKGMYLLCRLFPDYHAMAAQYPFLRKLPVLLPVTWILRALRLIKTRRTVIRGEFGALKNNIK